MNTPNVEAVVEPTEPPAPVEPTEPTSKPPSVDDVKKLLTEFVARYAPRDPTYEKLVAKFSDRDMWVFLNESARLILERGGFTEATSKWLEVAVAAVMAAIEGREYAPPTTAPTTAPATATAPTATAPPPKPASPPPPHGAARLITLKKDDWLPALEHYVDTYGCPQVELWVRGRRVATGQLTRSGTVIVDGEEATTTAWLKYHDGTGSGNDAWRLSETGKKLATWYRELATRGTGHNEQ